MAIAGALPARQRPAGCYLQSGQQPAPLRRVAADVTVAVSGIKRAVSATILVFISRSSCPWLGDGAVYPRHFEA